MPNLLYMYISISQNRIRSLRGLKCRMFIQNTLLLSILAEVYKIVRIVDNIRTACQVFQNVDEVLHLVIATVPGQIRITLYGKHKLHT